MKLFFPNKFPFDNLCVLESYRVIQKINHCLTLSTEFIVVVTQTKMDSLPKFDNYGFNRGCFVVIWGENLDRNHVKQNSIYLNI